ncbi:unnamed protein product [Gadus morhua 'NCC']
MCSEIRNQCGQERLSDLLLLSIEKDIPIDKEEQMSALPLSSRSTGHYSTTAEVLVWGLARSNQRSVKSVPQSTRAPVSPHETSASKMSTWDDASPLIKRCVWSVRAEPLLLVSCCRRSIRLLLSSPSIRLKSDEWNQWARRRVGNHWPVVVLVVVLTPSVVFSGSSVAAKVSSPELWADTGPDAAGTLLHCDTEAQTGWEVRRNLVHC